MLSYRFNEGEGFLAATMHLLEIKQTLRMFSLYYTSTLLSILLSCQEIFFIMITTKS